jgi:hypothetical protein
MSIDTEELGYRSIGERESFLTEEYGWLDKRAVDAMNAFEKDCEQKARTIDKLNRRIDMLLDLLEESRQPSVEVVETEPSDD